MNISEEYNGHTIRFDEEKESWYVTIDGRTQHHNSIKIIKNFIDRKNKKDFERIPIFITKKYGYGYGTGDGYEKATITSIGVDETVYIVREGSKSAEHAYRNIYIRNDKNAKLIVEIADLTKKIKELESLKDKKEKAMKEVDIDKIIKDALKQ